jgi:hypothetical protein
LRADLKPDGMRTVRHPWYERLAYRLSGLWSRDQHHVEDGEQQTDTM